MKVSIRVRGLFMGVFFIAILSACSSSPESTIEKFYQAVEKGEISEAKQYVSRQLLSMLGGSKIDIALTEYFEKIQSCGGIANLETKLTGEGELRTGTVHITFKGDCPVKTEKTKLIKEDGVWKITASK
jgi:hypothetical protein